MENRLIRYAQAVSIKASNLCCNFPTVAEATDANIRPDSFKQWLLGAPVRYGFRDDT